MTKVYNAKKWDGGKFFKTPHKGTKQWISSIRAEPILETEEEVSESDIDAQGRYVHKNIKD